MNKIILFFTKYLYLKTQIDCIQKSILILWPSMIFFVFSFLLEDGCIKIIKEITEEEVEKMLPFSQPLIETKFYI